MSVIANWGQQPGETLDWDIFYGGSPDGSEDWLSFGDSIQSVVTTVDAPGLSVVSSCTEKRVKLWVSGGVSGVKYKVTITITTANGRTKQDEVYFRIREV